MAALLAGLAVAPRAEATTDEDVYRAIRPATATPAARSIAMGGAILARVDDPAAVSINPARLVSMTVPEALFGLRVRQFDDGSVSSGFVRLGGPSDPYAGGGFSGVESAEESPSPAFLAYAHPIDLARPVVLGIARVDLLDASVSAESSSRTTPPGLPATPGAGDEVLRLSRGRLDVSMVRYDVAAGWRITPRFSVGGGIAVGTIDLSSSGTGSLADPLQLTGPGMFDPRFGGAEAEPLIKVRSGGSDTGLGFTFGAWWRAAGSISLATVYRRGERFEIDGRARDLLRGTDGSFTNVIKVPDTAALGLSWTPFGSHPSARLRSMALTLELERVEYSDRLEGFVGGLNIMTRPDFIRTVEYDLDDALEVRAGFEMDQQFPSWTLAMRGGLYTEHDGRVHLAGASGDTGSMQGQSRLLEETGFHAAGDTEVHVTVGAGARFYGFSVEAAIDLSDPTTQMIVSGTYRFR